MVLAVVYVILILVINIVFDERKLDLKVSNRMYSLQQSSKYQNLSDLQSSIHFYFCNFRRYT